MELIDKSAVVAEIEDWRDKIKKGIFSIPLTGSDRAYATFEYEVLGKVLLFLGTFKVKEVDLNEGYIEEIYSHIDGIRDTADRMTSGNFMHHRAAIKFFANVIGQVLGLIGLKAKKGE